MKTKKDFTLSVDRVLSIMYRILSITTCLFVVASFAVSCFAEPIRSKADYVIDDYFPDWYWDYLDNSTREFWTIEQNRRELYKRDVQDALNDSEITQQEKRDIISVDGLQDLFFNTWLNIYNKYSVNNFADLPDSFTVSGGGITGVYSYQNKVKTGSLFIPTSNVDSGSFTLFTSSDMSIMVSPSNTSNLWQTSVASSSSTWAVQFGVLGSASSIDVISSDTSLQPSFVVASHVASGVRFLNPLGSNLPVWTSGNFIIDSSLSVNNLNRQFIGQSQNLSLPVSSDVPNPWTYYNNVLLPYMKNNFNVTNNFYLFPNGYSAPLNLPDLHVDPTVIAPPIIAGAGAIIIAGNASFDIFAPISICPQFSVDGITFQFPTGGDNVYIDSLPYNIPSSGITFGDKIIDIIDKGKVIIDGVQFLLDGDDLTIDDITFNLPIGSPNIAPSEVFDYEYLISTETLADIRLPDSSLPLNAELPSSVSNTLPALWDTIFDVLNNSGLWSIFPWLFGLSCCLYIVHKLGN